MLSSDVNSAYNPQHADLYDKNISSTLEDGGTIAKFCAHYGMNVIDCGVAVLSMHAPWEITSVFDVETAYEAYRAFLTLAYAQTKLTIPCKNAPPLNRHFCVF